MSGASLGYNIAEDATGTWAAYTILQAKSDGGATISEADTDDYPGAIWFNFVDDILIQINQVFQGAQQVDAFDILGTFEVDGTSTFNNDVSITGAFGVTGASGLTGDLNVTGSVAVGDELTLHEAASVPGGVPTATHGKIWLKNDTPNTLYFTDDGGTDHQLGAGGVSTRELFFEACNGFTAVGDFMTLEISASSDDRLVFHAPADFSSIANLELILIPAATDGTHDIDLDSDYGAVGQAYNTHSESDNATTYSLTANQLYALDISGVYSSLAAGDYCGLKVTNNDGTDSIYLVGIRFKYNV